MKKTRFETHILNMWQDFSDREKNILSYFLDNYEGEKNIQELAELADVSTATISKLCKKIGYSNYKELIYDFKLSQAAKESDTKNFLTSTIVDSYKNIVNEFGSIDYKEEDIKNIVEMIHDNKVIAYGTGTSFSASKTLRHRLSKLGKLISVPNNKSQLLIESMGSNEKTILVLISSRGNTKEVVEIKNTIKEKTDIKVIAITFDPESKITIDADYVVLAPKVKDYNSYNSIGAQLSTELVLEMIFQYYARQYDKEIQEKWLLMKDIVK